jgi:hypothetical protein
MIATMPARDGFVSVREAYNKGVLYWALANGSVMTFPTTTEFLAFARQAHSSSPLPSWCWPVCGHARRNGDDLVSEIRIKRGTSLNLVPRFRRSDGLVAAVTHMVCHAHGLEAKVRDRQDCLIDTFPLIKLPEIGLVSVMEADTSQWPIGCLHCDLTAASGGQMIYSETFAIQVARSVT